MTTEGVKRKVTAILSADVKGYSRLMEADEAATVQTLKAYRKVMTSLIQQYHGRVVDSPGDNLLAEFTSVVEAVDCSVKIQSELKAKNLELPENRRMEFRLGIHLGDVIEDGERIYGDGINIAARIEGLAEGGGICISRTAYDSVKNKLSLGYEYLGEHIVKNMSEPVRVYRVLTEPEAAGKVIGEEMPKPRQWRWAALAVALIIVIAAIAIWNFYLRRPSVEPASVDNLAFPLPDNPSIAILPFDNLSGDPNQDYFIDGLTEEIITALSRVPQLFVIARNSTFTYKGKPVKIKQVAEEFGVRYVLEGSVRTSEDRVRISTQLVDAITGHYLWSERYDRELKNIFALQDEITIKIITALRVKLTTGDEARLTAKGTENLQAYLKYLKARESFFIQTKEGNTQARRLVEEVIDQDSEFPEAYALLGATHWMDVIYGSSESPRESLRRAFESTRKAIALDDSHATAHSLLGWLYLLMERQYDKAIAECERAIELAPNSASSNIWMGFVLTLAGRHEEAVRYSEHALRLNPLPEGWYFRFLGYTYFGVGQYEKAIAAYKKALNRAPNDIITHLALTTAYSWANRPEEARVQAAEVLRINPKFSVKQRAKTLPYKNQADLERYLDGLRKAGLPETPPLPLPEKPSIAVLPFVNMSGDPEQEYFSDGISEEIITALSKTPKLFVIARTSSFKYKGKEVDVRTVGRELGVRHVLEGSVRRVGDEVRITAQLVDAKTGNHVWAERYDRDLKDIFTLQDEITKKIITALQVKLTAGEQARLSSRGTDNLDAYLKYLAGREHLFRFNKDDNLIARQKAEEAIALDPKYSDAYSLLGKTHILDVWFKWSESPKGSMGNAFKLAKKALALNEDNSGAHRILSNIYLLKRQHDEAIAESQRAVSLAPNAADEIYQLGVILRFSGKAKEAVSMFESAIRLNPMPPASYLYQLGLSYAFIGEFEKAIAICKKALPENPNDFVGRITLTIAYSSLGREEEARSEATEVLRIDPNFTLEYALKTWPYKNQADRDLVVGALRKAGLK